MPDAKLSLTPSAALADELTLLDTESPGRTMALVISMYSALWIAVTVLLSPTVPYDAVEAWHWGQALEAGSPKNPWLVGLAAALGHYWPLSWPAYWYTSHIVAVAIGAWGCWKLCERLIPDTRHAMLAVLMMSYSATISIDMLPYNDNYLLMMLWPWMGYGFIRALYDTPRYWLQLGAVMALAGMAKYTTVLYVPFMVAIIVWQGRLRTTLTQPWLWAGIGVGLVLIAPNVYWLSQHDFAAFRWFADRVGGGRAWDVARVYLAVFYNALLIAVVLKLSRWHWRWPMRPEVQSFVVLAVVPVVLLGLYFAVRGGVRTEWMMPFAVPLGLAVVMCMTPSEQGRFRLPLYIGYIIAALMLCGFGASKAWQTLCSTRPRDHVASLAVTLDEWWQERYQQPLHYVGGSRFGDWVGLYAPDHPRTPTRWPSAEVRAATPEGRSPYPNTYTPGLSDDQLARYGAMWVGDANSLCNSPDVLELDPSLSAELRERIEYHTLIFQQNRVRSTSFSVCVGVLPPTQRGAVSELEPHANTGIVTEEE